MNKKIISIFVCTLFIATVAFTATGTYDEDIIGSKHLSKGLIIDSFDDDVPIWEIGDGWEYRINDIELELGFEGQSVQIHGKIDSLYFEVTEVSDDSYKLDYNSKVDGGFNVDIDLDYLGLGDGSIKTTGELVVTKLSGDMILKKSDLGIKEINAKIAGMLKVKIEEQPFIPFPTITILIPARINLNSNSDNPFTILDFPLSTGKTWGLPSATFSVDGEIKSIWLNALKFINKVAGLLGRELIPPVIADLLPVIDIMDLIEALDLIDIFNGYLERDEYPDVLSCSNIETVTVEAGTFDAYNISVMKGLGHIYYAPEVGNIIKISGHSIDSELIKVYNV